MFEYGLSIHQIETCFLFNLKMQIQIHHADEFEILVDD